MTITGTGFAGASSVKFGSTTAASYSVTATTITAVTAAHAAGTVAVSVTTGYGTGTSASDFSFVAPPTVTASHRPPGPPTGAPR